MIWKIIDFIRYVIAYLFLFTGFVTIFAEPITWTIIMIMWFLIFPDTWRKKIWNKIKSIFKISDKIKKENKRENNEYVKEKQAEYNYNSNSKGSEENPYFNIKIESTCYEHGDYSNFICWSEKFNIWENQVLTDWYIFWEKILEAYKTITIKYEEIKQYWDMENMKWFEKDTHIFFKERVLSEAVRQWFLKDTKPELSKPNYNFREAWNYREYLWRNLTSEEMREAKRLFELEQEEHRKRIKRTIYDLYCKTLRRVWNYYKNYKEWQLALDAFLTIKEFWFEWIMDWKNIVKCSKELDMLSSKNLLSGYGNNWKKD